MTMTTRDKLISLLSQIPTAKEIELHDGRVMAPDRRVEEAFADKIMMLLASEDLFAQIMTASAAYVTRFGGTLNHYGAAKKMDEEMREFDTSAANYVHARLSTTPMSMRLKTPDQLEREMLQEYIDFMVTVGGWFAAMGIDWDEVKQAAHETLDKLDARTPDTHAWNPDTMTVERIGKVTP